MASRAEDDGSIGILAGSLWGVTAAIVYTLANIALRRCVGIDPLLVVAIRAIPTVVLLAPVLVWMRLRGRSIASSGRMIPRFMIASLIGQVVGNGSFQVALGIIGLAASVPITLGVLILSGAVLGRVLLAERVSPRKIVAMITLITAVFVLSTPNVEPPEGAWPVWVGALAAAACGVAYAIFGVALRRSLNGGLSTPLTMFISGCVGTCVLGSITMLRLGVAPLREIPLEQWWVMTAAGVFNFAAFGALSLSLKALPVVAVNLINASQVAMAAVAGVVLFAEPVTASLLLGVVLTCVGLLILAGRVRRKPELTAG